MNTDTRKQLIKGLGDELECFTPVFSPLKAAVLWLVAMLGLLFIILGVRDGAGGNLLSSIQFSLEVGSGLLAIFFVAWLTFTWGAPGRSSKSIAFAAGATSLAFVTAWAYSYFVSPALPASMHGKRSICFTEALALGSLILVSLLFLFNRRSPFQRFKTGVIAGALACGMTGLFMQVSCMYDPLHALTHHFSPVLIMVTVGGALGMLFLKKI